MIAGIAIAAALIALTSMPAMSGPLEPMRFAPFSPCAGSSPSFCGDRILAEGTIEPDTDRKFLAFLQSKVGGGLKDTSVAGTYICFNSPGGNLLAAMKLGRTIRKFGLNTCLAPQYSRVQAVGTGDEEVFVKNALCASACAVAFVGGVNRMIDDHSRYGIHQFQGANGNVGDGTTQVTVVAVASYLEEMGVSRALLDAASLIPPDSIYWLFAEELRDLRVDNMSITSAQWRLNALEDGTVVATIDEVKPGSQNRVSLIIVKIAGVPTLIIVMTPKRNDLAELDSALDVVSGNDVTLQVDGRTIAEFESVNWRRGKGDITTVLRLSPQAVAEVKRGRILNVQVFVPHAAGEAYDPSLKFPLEGLARFLAAVLK